VKRLLRIALFHALIVLALLPVVSSAFTPFPKAEGVDVANLVSDPFAYKGELTLRGAVMNVDPGKKMFHIIDYREYRACRTVDCAKEWTSVLYDGKPPERMNVVEVTGTVERNAAGKDGFVLRAKGVKVK
jgi:hypothetical protein